MKRWLLFGFLGASISVLAKTTETNFPSIFPFYGTGTSVVVFPGLYQSRILAQSYHLFHNGNWVSQDSTIYTYSNGRGGQLTKEDLQDDYVGFDESIQFKFDTIDQFFQPIIRRFQSFNQAGKTKLYTIQEWAENNINHVWDWKNYGRYQYVYDNDFIRINTTKFQIYYGGTWATHVVYDNTFSGNLLVKTAASTYEWYYEYDMSGRLISRTEKQRMLVNGTFTPWFFTNKYLFSYDVNGQLIEKITQKFDVNWLNTDQELYTYLNGNLSQVALCTWDNQAWSSVGHLLHEYDILNNKISTIYQIPDTLQGGWLNNWKQNWLYNSFNQPIQYASNTWSATQNQWTVAEGDFIHRYYYQTYNPNSVVTPNNAISNWTIFPSPAHDGFYVQSKNGEINNNQFQIFDAVGRKLSPSISIESQNKFYVDTRQLPSGQYWFVAENSFSKQIEPIVVTH